MGFKNVRCLGGGVEAWKKAGYPDIKSECSE
jgi:3-mercaptopyruvate sulfurtransferase SseA